MIEIDLSSPQGNAFFLLGTARKLGKEIGMSPAEIDTITKKMTSGDYNNLLDTLVESFPGFDFQFDNDPRSPE